MAANPSGPGTRRGPIWAPPERDSGSLLLAAVYSLGFYIVMSLVMTLGFGFGGIVDLAWVLVAAAWVGTAGWLIAHRRSRTTGLGMVASVVVVGLVLLIVAGLGALTLQG